MDKSADEWITTREAIPSGYAVSISGLAGEEDRHP
jgi:hypothetical protein